MAFRQTLLTLALAVSSQAQFGNYGGDDSNGYDSSNNPFANGGGDDNSGGGSSSSNNPSANGQSGFFGGGGNFGHSPNVLIAHGVMASLAFVLFFPIGAILIRLGSFRGLWLVHGLFQTLAYLIYIAAFGIGVWLAINMPGDLLSNSHPIIGIVLLVLLFFQPFLGVLHHVMFKKHSRRVIWSYGHIWLGRIGITLGIINGGLGLRLARMTGMGAPTDGQIIAYGVVAGVMWLAYVASAVFGEIKRRRQRSYASPPAYKERDGEVSDEATQPGAPQGVGEYYKEQSRGQQYQQYA